MLITHGHQRLSYHLSINIESSYDTKLRNSERCKVYTKDSEIKDYLGCILQNKTIRNQTKVT
mgnify:CR=1 FL=1